MDGQVRAQIVGPFPKNNVANGQLILAIYDCGYYFNYNRFVFK